MDLISQTFLTLTPDINVPIISGSLFTYPYYNVLPIDAFIGNGFLLEVDIDSHSYYK